MSIDDDGFRGTPEGQAWAAANERDRIERDIALTSALIVDLVSAHPDMPKDELDARVRTMLRNMIGIGENNG